MLQQLDQIEDGRPSTDNLPQTDCVQNMQPVETQNQCLTQATTVIMGNSQGNVTNMDQNTEKSATPIKPSHRCCSLANQKLAFHLSNNAKCRKTMAATYNLRPNSPVSEIMLQRKRVLRKSYPSRSINYRKQFKSNSDLLIKTKASIAKLNATVTCYICKFVTSNFDKMVEYVPEEPARTQFARNGKFYICQDCHEAGPHNIDAQQISENVVLHRFSLEDRNVFLPEMCLEKPTCQVVFPPSLLLPVELVHSYNSSKPPTSRGDVVKALNTSSGQDVGINNYMSSVYETMMYYIQQRQIADRTLAKGKIIDENNKMIKLCSSNISLARVKGTRDYYNKIKNENAAFYLNNGILSLSICIDLKKDAEQIFHQYLIDINEVLVVVNNDEETGDSYFVHEHPPSNECSEQCQENAVEMMEYLRKLGLNESALEETRFLPAVCNFYNKLFTSYSKMIRLMDNYKCEHFYSQIKFPILQEPTLHCILWPTEFESFNKKISSTLNPSYEEVWEFQKKIDELVTTIMDKEDFISLGYTSNEATLLVKLVSENQYNTSAGTMPSQMSLITRPALPVQTDSESFCLNEVIQFTENMYLLRQYFQEKISNVPHIHFKPESNYSLNDFFQSISNNDQFSISEQNGTISIQLPELEPLEFKYDEILKKYLEEGIGLLESVYHRCLTICRVNDEFKVIIKRPFLKMVYVSPYHPSLILATKGRVHVKVVGSDHSFESNRVVNTIKPESPELRNFYQDHEEINMLNAMYLLNGKSYRIFQRSSSPLFVEPSLSKTKSFKKVLQYDEKIHYTDVNTGAYYALQSNSYESYLSRDGLRYLSYCQFLMYYKSDSSESDNNSEGNECMENETVEVVTFDNKNNELLPTILTTKKGQRFVLNKKPKIVYHRSVDQKSDEYIQFSVVLYHPHSNVSEIEDESKQVEIFNRVYNDKTRIENVRQKLYPFYVDSLYSKIDII